MTFLDLFKWLMEHNGDFNVRFDRCNRRFEITVHSEKSSLRAMQMMVSDLEVHLARYDIAERAIVRILQEIDKVQVYFKEPNGNLRLTQEN